MPSKIHNVREERGVVCYLNSSGACQCRFATRVLAHAGENLAIDFLEEAEDDFEAPKEWGPEKDDLYESDLNDSDDDSGTGSAVDSDGDTEAFEIMTPPESTGGTEDNKDEDNKDKISSDQVEVPAKNGPSKFSHHDYTYVEIVADLKLAQAICHDVSEAACNAVSCFVNKQVNLEKEDRWADDLTSMEQLEIANDCKDFFRTLKNEFAHFGKKLNDDRFADGKWANMGAMALKKLLSEMELDSKDVKELQDLGPEPKLKPESAGFNHWGAEGDTKPMSDYDWCAWGGGLEAPRI